MVKRADHGQDPTMELSASQLLRDLPPAGARPKVPVNDVSMWGRKVVGTDEFAPAAKRREPRSPRWLIAGVLGAAVVAGAGYAYWTLPGESAPPADAAKQSVRSSATAPPQPALTRSPGIDTGVASDKAKPVEAARPDAAVAMAGPRADAAATPDLPDAISAVAPIIRPNKAAAIKRPTTKTAAVAATKRPVAKKLSPKQPAPKRRTR